MRVCSGKLRFPVSPLGLCLPLGQGGSVLPPAPCALVLCWWSLELETNSKSALLCGEGGWGLKSLVCTDPRTPHSASYGGTHLGPISEKAQNKLLGAAFTKVKLSSGNQARPNACLLRKAVLSVFSPRSVLAIGPRRFCAAYCSLGTGAVLVVSGDGNQLQMCTPLRRRRMGTEKALCALALTPHIPLAREGPT